jgi:GH25 family lysozyme M1 (1,4-beta-N-acetylmuramidase)
MSDQKRAEIIKALAYGESPEQAAAADGVTVAEVQRIAAADVDEIQAEREVLRKAGYLRSSSAGPPRKARTVNGEPWIDVSAHQGVIDWAHVAAAGIKGAVLRAGYGNDASQEDTQFAANIAGTIAAGLKVAIYWFSYAVSVDDAIQEWAVCRKIILPYRGKILFVASDYEYDSVSYYHRIYGADPTHELINSMVMAFRGAAAADSWPTCIYLNNDYRRNVFTPQTLSAFNFIWLADYSGAADIPCALQQTGSTGKVSGISGNVDLDSAFSTFNVANPPYTCDTSGTVVIARGSAYQALITCKGAPRAVAGTSDVVTVLHRYDDGDKHYYYIVPIGRSGDQAGIYINGGGRQFIAKVK